MEEQSESEDEEMKPPAGMDGFKMGRNGSRSEASTNKEAPRGASLGNPAGSSKDLARQVAKLQSRLERLSASH